MDLIMHLCSNTVLLEIKCPFKYWDLLSTSDIPLSDREFCFNRSPIGDVHLSEVPTGISTRFKVNLLCAMLPTVISLAGRIEDFLLRGLKRKTRSCQKLSHLQLFKWNICYRSFWHVTLNLNTLTLTKRTKFSACHKPESGRMIACNNPRSSIAWFHYKCVGIKRAPQGKWCCSI